MFINISNHASSKWSVEQLANAEAIGGEIADFALPNIPPQATSEEVSRMAKAIVADAIGPVSVGETATAMVAGPFGFCRQAVAELEAHGITCVEACSERSTREETLPDGTTRKIVEFKFVQFREV